MTITHYSRERTIAAGAPWGHRKAKTEYVTVAGRGLDTLRMIRLRAGERQTQGLADLAIASFLNLDPTLTLAIDRAARILQGLSAEEADLLRADESTLCSELAADYISLHGAPYVPLSAAGPWIVTTHGAVLHDSGGYGMLGLGHAPPALLASLREPWVMANVMTPSLSQRRFSSRLKKEIGKNRDSYPFEKFVCLNSGSEAISLACRISDIHALRHGKPTRILSLKGSFHSRTERPVRLSHLSRAIDDEHLASLQEKNVLEVVEPNDIDGLRAVFGRAEDEGVFFESFFIEPVMGEDQPGLALTREFYDEARRLTREQNTLLVVDSIQAAFRAHGCLSIIDYPGFEDCEPPDMETYSKALNAGQFPLSVVALTQKAADLYVIGIYDNTMAANPRALESGCTVLDGVTDELRRNIQERGQEFLQKLKQLAKEQPQSIQRVSGTGLILSIELNPTYHKVEGHGGIEERLRRMGIALIHCGRNGLRLTPHFAITRAEIDLIMTSITRVLQLDIQRAAA